MINPISQSNTKTSIFYINDYHGKSLNMERTVTAANAFDSRNKNKSDTDTLKLSSGDIMIGEDYKTNELAILFQNYIGIKDSAIGNHEYDMQDKIKSVLPLTKYNLLASNVHIAPNSAWFNTVKPATVEVCNGNKYGIIGTSPIDLYKRSKVGVLQKEVQVDKVKETIQDIQKEADKLQKQGINKIILLSL